MVPVSYTGLKGQMLSGNWTREVCTGSMDFK